MLAVVASRNKVLAGVTGRLALTGVPGRKRCWQEGRAAGRWQERPGRRKTGRKAGLQANRQVLAGRLGRRQTGRCWQEGRAASRHALLAGKASQEGCRKLWECRKRQAVNQRGKVFRST